MSLFVSILTSMQNICVGKQGRRSGYESGGDGIHVNPERSFGGRTGSHRAKRANFGRGSGGPPPEHFKNLHCKWCNLRYSLAIFVNIISLYCNKTCINYASFITIQSIG